MGNKKTLGKSYNFSAYVPEESEDLFEKSEILSVSEKDLDADYWITYKPITPCRKCFQLEISTFKKAMGKEFLDELQELVARHSTTK